MTGIVAVAGDNPFWVGMHEIGHALGVNHPLGGGSEAVFNGQQTIMSYWRWPKDLFATFNVTPYGLSNANFRYIFPETPSVLDIAAIQYIYGANTRFNAGDNVYTFSQSQPFFKTSGTAAAMTPSRLPIS